MKRKIVLTLGLIASSLVPHVLFADAIGGEIGHLEKGNLILHIIGVAISIIAAIFMTALTRAFKGGLFEKVWRRFMFVSYLFAIFAIYIYFEETGILSIHYFHEVLVIIIPLLLVSAANSSLKQLLKK